MIARSEKDSIFMFHFIENKWIDYQILIVVLLEIYVVLKFVFIGIIFYWYFKLRIEKFDKFDVFLLSAKATTKTHNKHTHNINVTNHA